MGDQVEVYAYVDYLRKGQSTNSTSNAWGTNLPTITQPAASATRSVVCSRTELGSSRTTLEVTPYGGNTNNDIINLKVLGWNRTPGTTSPYVAPLWVPHLICEVQATLSSTLVGVAGRDVIATEFFADTLTLTYGVAVLYQGAGDVDIARFECGISGFEIVEIDYKTGTGGDTMNSLWRLL